MAQDPAVYEMEPQHRVGREITQKNTFTSGEELESLLVLFSRNMEGRRSVIFLLMLSFSYLRQEAQTIQEHVRSVVQKKCMSFSIYKGIATLRESEKKRKQNLTARTRISMASRLKKYFFEFELGRSRSSIELVASSKYRYFHNESKTYPKNWQLTANG